MSPALFVLSIASLAAAPQDVLYDFYSTSCGPCQMMMPIVHRLQEEGHPVQKIDINQRPDLASRYNVQSVPTFILVVGGSEQQRLVGWQYESTLRGLLAQIPSRKAAPEQVADSSSPPRPRRSLPVRLAQDDSQSSKWDFHLPLPSFGRNKSQDMVQIDPPSSGSGSRPTADASLGSNALADASLAGRSPGDDLGTGAPGASDQRGGSETGAGDDARTVRPSVDPEVAKMLSSSVRIRVRDAEGVYFGSGVVIDSAPGKTLILTCAHILRDARQGSRIEVDIFEGKRSRQYRAAIVKSDPDADVGLVAIATRFAVPVAPVASIEDAVRRGDSVVSIGCSQGELPSVERLHVTTLNRYLGPDTFECTGVPGQGRSGGGLFTSRGCVVGVCTNADLKESKGVYAGLKPIHDLLRWAGLEELIPAPAKSRRDSLAEAAPVRTETARTEAAETVSSKVSREDPLSSLPAVPTEMNARTAERSQPAQSLVAEGGEPDLSAKMLEQSEVICIIRPVNQPHGNSHVVVINRASRKFLSYLKGEMKDPLVPAMRRSPRDDRSTDVSAAEPPREAPPGNLETTETPRTTAAWKPSCVQT